jgi:hypothetical protein
MHIKLWSENLKRPLGRPQDRWEDIRLNFMDIRCEGVDWIHLAQDWYLW